MSRDRAYRRHQREKRYRRYRPLLEWWWGYNERTDQYSWFWRSYNSHINRDPEREIHIAVRRHQDNMPICSCWSCGNPRRGEGNRRQRLTIVERRAEDSAQSQINEIGAPRWPGPGTPWDIWHDEQEHWDWKSDYNLDPEFWHRLRVDSNKN